MFGKVLIANRGVIACRIIRTLKRMGIASVAVYSEAEEDSLHVAQADEAVCLGEPQAALSYLDVEKVLGAAKRTGAEAIHPGYGFLSENAAFAEACSAAGVKFIGPRPEQIRAFGLKHTARELADRCGVPLLPGSGLLHSAKEALAEAERIGYPVMLKSTAGGGGIGMRICHSADELLDSYDAVRRLSEANFRDGGIYLERFVQQARHIEIQIFGDGRGHVLPLGERDCSVQRRNQKVVEETPAPGLSEAIRSRLFAAAVRLGEAVQYESAGTVEFIYDGVTGEFFFLEVNTRLQVEHGVTEEVTGVDLVEWMIRQAHGSLQLPQAVRAEGHSIQVRVYAEDPGRNYQPCAGSIHALEFPSHTRVETWVEAGTAVTPFYDPLVAKVIVKGRDRAAALKSLRSALDGTAVRGIVTNLELLRQVAAHEEFQEGGVSTAFLTRMGYRESSVEVLDGGTQTTVQDYPGRLGYWAVGVPPSGPMDALAFRFANRLVGNAGDAAGLEMAISGPSLRFHRDAVIAITGADMGAAIDGKPAPMWSAFEVAAGSVLKLGAAATGGSRAYLAIRGGFDVPVYLGSRSTFLLGKFGGHAGSALRAGDRLSVWIASGDVALQELPSAYRPVYGRDWEIGVLYGPHGAPDFFTAGDMDALFAASWKVHYNSDRTGVRLLGPKPEWARKDGGEAGLHPSNLHDNGYSVGAIDFTGDMPVMLGPDGPSLGGFVCPAVVVAAERWKLGQLHAGDRVRFRRLTLEQAGEMERATEEALRTLRIPLPSLPAADRDEPAVLRRNEGATTVVARAAGDKYLLLEYGENLLDLNLRFRVHALVSELEKLQVPGLVDLTPGIRSLHIHYDSGRLSREELLSALDAAERAIPDLDDISVPSRIVHMPLSWDDPATQEAIRRYTQSVRPDAPWCPSNIEFIRRINGLASAEDVYRLFFDASYLVMGLGDVYLGAPVATPVDPRHRLVTTKYNPARTWTPENAVGIGGAYLCIYGMEGPGGYQFVGRTVQVWNTHRATREFRRGTPWLLRFFDQLRFYPVSAKELLEMRRSFPLGRFHLRMEEQTFSLREYHGFLKGIASETAEFRKQQRAAFLEERERWAAAGQAEIIQAVDEDDGPPAEAGLPEGCQPLSSPVTASVWNIAVEPGQRVTPGQKMVVLEAMKMEVVVTAPAAGTVEELRCRKGGFVMAGQALLVFRPEEEAA
ncbi:MAG: urea carboxylase [Bryobacterales bacterium]|nr:urea carboxylase [Bryobacterales bacterium]